MSTTIMFDQYFRTHGHNGHQLQDDLKSTMRSYQSDRERLAHQLSSLQGTERSYTSLSDDSESELSSSFMESRSRKFFRAPNIAALSSANSQISNSSRSEGHVPTSDKRWKERRDADKIKKEREMLKLPVIHSASRRSEWQSGKGLPSKKSESWSGIDPLPGISAAKALLSQSMKIPSIYDPDRSDTAFDTLKSKKERKKVTFADDTKKFKENLNSKRSMESLKMSSKDGSVPKLNLSANQFSHVIKPVRIRKTSLLPPLEISPREIRDNPEQITDGINNWKNVYSNIIDPEERTRALTDILNAVRLKKWENEQTLNHGHRSQSEDNVAVLSGLLMNANDKIIYRDEHGNKKPGIVPGRRNSSVRAGGRHRNAVLQSYLHKMSRSRCLMNKLHSQTCSLSSFRDQKALSEAMRKSSASVDIH